MNKIKSLIAVILVIVMALCIFTGCSGNEPTATEDNTEVKTSNDNELIANQDRTEVKNSDGEDGFSRLYKFYTNYKSGKEDSVRIVTDYNGYPVTEDLIAEISGGKMKLKLVIDNTKNKWIDTYKRVVETIEYDDFTVELDSGARIYKFVNDDGSGYIVAKQILYS